MLFSRIKSMRLKSSIEAITTNSMHFRMHTTPMHSNRMNHNKFANLSESISKMIDTTDIRRPDWDRAMTEGGKLVEYPSTLPCQKSAEAHHPLLKTMKNATSQIERFTEKNRNLSCYRDRDRGRNNMQEWDLLVLLISKAAGQASNVLENEQEKRTGVLRSQRVMAEICEMIRMFHLIHQGLIDTKLSKTAPQDLHGDMIFRNKITLLSGDHLQGNMYVQLANLRDQDVYELISSAVRDIIEAEFIGDRDEQNNPLPTQPPQSPTRLASDVLEEYDLHLAEDFLKPMEKERFMGNPETEWALRNVLCAGSLLGKSCLGALKLAGLPESTQKLGFHFGKHLVLAWQACLDLEPFVQPKSSEDVTFSLVSAPVLFHLEYDPNAYELIKKGHVSVENVDYKTLRSEILKGPGVEKTQNLQRKHSAAAMNVLKKFPPSDARTALENILHAMQDL